MKRSFFAAAVAVALGVGGYAALRPSALTPDPAPPVAPADGAALVRIVLPDSLSAQAQMGERAFQAVCAACHGDNATGRMNMGPPLVHKIYEPGHHGDFAFQMAVDRGVQSHHWRFGDMPPQKGLTRSDVANIVAYVRALQVANGIH